MPEEDNVLPQLVVLLSMILALAALLELLQFSVLNHMDKSHLTIVLKKVKLSPLIYKTGLAHRERTNVQLKKMF